MKNDKQAEEKHAHEHPDGAQTSRQAKHLIVEHLACHDWSRRYTKRYSG